MELNHLAMALGRHVTAAGQLPSIRKEDLRTGDAIMVQTFNSLYTIRVLGENRYAVSGGWFDKKGIAPLTTSISGCTWGGSVIKIDIVAACGLCIEFGNRVTTSMVRSIAVFPFEIAN